MSYHFVIEGQAGAGKTPLISEMYEQLTKKGFSVNIVAPFAAANNMIINSPSLLEKFPVGIYNAWLHSIETAIWAEQWLENYIYQELNKNADIVIFDRGWLTICMGISESSLEQSIIDEKFDYWMSKNVPTFFLDTDPEITQSRKSWNPLYPWTNENIHTDFLKRRTTISKYNNLIDRFKVTDSRIDLQNLSQRWLDKILIDIDSK